MKTNKLYIMWVVLVCLWNFGFPEAGPTLDVLVAVLLSLIIKILELNLFLKKKAAGNIKIVITKRLNVNKPVKLRICKTSVNHDQLYAQRFHGKPVRILLLT